MVQLTGIYIKYGDRTLLNKVSLSIKTGDRIGLVGRNGAGKSTLLKIIAGETVPDAGSVERPKGSTLGFLHQDIDISEDKTILEEAMTAFEASRIMQERVDYINGQLEKRTDYESKGYITLIEEMSELSEQFQLLDGQTEEGKAQFVLEGLGFKPTDMNRPIKEFSGGWKMRVELGKILLQQPDYMLLDEPTNHLDIESILWLEEFMTTYTGSIVVISHDKTFLDNITKKTVEVELGKLYEYNLPYTGYLSKREERRTILQSQYENQQRTISEKERTIERFRAKANKAKMAQSMIKELNRMDRIELDQENSSKLRIRFLPAPRIGAMVFKAENLTKSFDELLVMDSISIQIDRNDKIAFVGQNGQGKTTLSKIIAGLWKPTSGTLEMGHNVELGYYAQDQADTLDRSLTVLKTMENAARNEMRTKVRSILGAFMFSGEDVEKKVSVLSGGEKARLALAKLLLEPINLLILDEPTNHLDILAKQVLKSALTNFDGTMIVVSHDRDFLDGLTSRTIEFRDKKLFDYVGDVNTFLEKRKARTMREVERNTMESQPKNKITKDRPRYNHDKTRKIEKQINTLEKTIFKLEESMTAQGFYAMPEAKNIISDYKKKKNNLNALYGQLEKIG